MRIGIADVLLDQPARADLAADLLIIGEVQLDGPLKPRAGLGGGPQRQKREGVGGEIGLRHRHAAAIHPAVDDLGAVRVAGPAFAGRHHVAMRVECDDRAVAEPVAHDEVCAADHAVGADQLVRDGMPLDREAQPFEQPGRRLGVGRAVARGIVGRHLDQLGQEVDLRVAVLLERAADGLGGVGHRGSSDQGCRRLAAASAMGVDEGREVEPGDGAVLHHPAAGDHNPVGTGSAAQDECCQRVASAGVA